MKFEIAHDFDVPVDEFERVLFHEGLPAILKDRMETMIDIEPMFMERSADTLVRKVKYSPVPLIKSVGAKKVDPAWMVWVEESSYDFATHKGTFTNVPTNHKIAELLKNGGTLEIRPTGSGSCQQVIHGDLEVKVFMVGKVAERLIKTNAVKILDEQAAVMKQVIANKEL